MNDTLDEISLIFLVCVYIMNVSKNTSGTWIWGSQMARRWIKNIIFNFMLQCEVVKSVRMSKCTSFNSNASFTKKAPQIVLITCRYLQKSDVCCVQCRHISCLMLSQCCQLNLHTNGGYTHLQCRHNCPSICTDWLPCLPDTRNNKEYFDTVELWLQLWE